MLARITINPDPDEPYLLSQGIRVGDLVFISGQAGYEDDGKIVDGSFQAEGEQTSADLRRALEAGGAELENVIKVSISLTEMNNFSDMMELRRTSQSTLPGRQHRRD